MSKGKEKTTVGPCTEVMQCPYCGHVISEIVVERSQVKKFKVDHKAKEIVPIDPLIHKEENWENTEYAYRCPDCDSLNVDELLCKYKLKEE